MAGRFFVTHGVVALAAAAMLVLALACASRTVATEFPASSPLSAESGEGPAASVTSSLQEDPPLPGGATDRWPGLRPASDRAGSTDAADGGGPSQPAHPAHHHGGHHAH